MKAKETPEKIYLYPDDRAGYEYETEWGDKPWGKDCIEYTRTDIFIDKACEYWYQYNRDIVKRHGTGCSEFTVNVEGFKKYLKGE